MSATIAAALKKIAVAFLMDKKTLKVLGGIVIGIIVIIIMPIIAIVSIFDYDLEGDLVKLEQVVIENMSDEEKAKLQQIENTMYAIEEQMIASGFTNKVKEAQVLYVLALYDYGLNDDFVEKLVGCFCEGRTDVELIEAVNDTFGTNILVEDFTNVMEGIRAVYIDISGYVNPSVKNNIDLVEWAKEAETSGWGYVWGTYGMVFDETLYEYKLEQYPEEIGEYSEFIEGNWLGKRTADCVGLIKGYGWLNVDTLTIEYGTNGMPDIDANSMYENATEKGTIDTIPEIPGLAVWQDGHIGIYIGNGEVIEAKGTMYGVVKTKLAEGSWTHWLKIPYITYLSEDDVGVEESTEDMSDDVTTE